MVTEASRDYRYERKFLIEDLDEHQVRSLLKRHPGMFHEPYPPRFINNLYLDSPDMENYHENVGGVGLRRKARIRWYGELLGKIDRPVLEFKIKRGLVGTKRQFRYPEFDLGAGYIDGIRVKGANSPDLPLEVKHYLRALKIVLMNRYYRHYFVTRDGRFRVTLDTGLTFYRVDRLDSRFTHRQEDHRNVVVELKYDIDEDVSAFKVSGYFPFRLTKSSKYIQGIERVFF